MVRSLRWVATAWIVVFWRLGYTTLLDPDEAHYAELTREMLRAKSWMVPLLDGQPFIDKPVLFHWLQGIAMTLLGESEFAARLPSACAAMALFFATRRIGIVLLGEEVGEWGALMFATIPVTFALASIGLFDMLFSAFLFSAVGCLLIAARDRRPWLEVSGYGLLALAVMTKGPVALVLVGLFFAAAWAAGGAMRQYVRGLQWPAGLFIAAIAASPWFVWMNAHFGQAFVQGYILAGNVFYLTQPPSFSGRSVSHWFYLRSFAGAFFPWSALVVGRAVDLARRRRTGLEWPVEERLLWLWAGLVFAFFSVARFKLDHYIFPAAPACCLIAAKAWRDAASERSRQVFATRASVLALASLFVAGGAFVATSIFELNLELPESAILLPIALGMGGVALLMRSARVGWHVPQQPDAGLATMLAIYALTVTIGFPTLQRIRPTAQAGQTLRRMTSGDTPAALYHLEQWRASLRYYADRPLARLDTPADVAAFLSPLRPSYVLMIRRDYRELRRAGLHLREVFKSRAVVGTTKSLSGFRRQQWDDLVLVTDAPERRRGYPILP